MQNSFLIAPNDRILVTGAAGFIGSRVAEGLIERGFSNIACFVRPSSDLTALDSLIARRPMKAPIEVTKGNLLSRFDCDAACRDAKVIFHVAAGTGGKSFPDTFLNSVVATRNLLDAARQEGNLKRFVLVSSFTVYTNRTPSRRLDESCPVESHPELRGDAYCYGKVKQEQLVTEYTANYGIPYVVVRPGSVYGGAKRQITGRVGLGTFGVFLHLGGGNTIPFTHVENCAEAIILAGVVKGIEGESFNVVDDNLPTSRQFLRLYKRNVISFKSFYVPHTVSYALCYLWEKYSEWSEGQLPPAFNRKRWRSEWKRTQYSNDKLKSRLGWKQKIPTAEALQTYFRSCAESRQHA